jgi:hypothetical protein
MSASDPSHNKRRSVRCSVSPSRRQSTLIIGRKTFPVQLVDESTGGFAVMIDHSPGMRVGDMARLETDWGLFEVRLARITRADSPFENDLHQGDGTGLWLRLGLCRVGDALQVAPKTVSLFSEDKGIFRGKKSSTNKLMLAGGFVLAILMIVATFGIIGIPRSWKPWGYTRPPEIKASEASRNRKITDSIRHTPGVQAILLPDVAGELKLSPEQTEAVRKLLDDLSKALQMIDREASVKKLPKEQLSAIHTQLQEESRKEALKLLNSQQRLKWNQLNGKP